MIYFGWKASKSHCWKNLALELAEWYTDFTQKPLLCQDSGMSLVGKPPTPTRCGFWTESCMLNFSPWPLLYSLRPLTIHLYWNKTFLRYVKCAYVRHWDPVKHINVWYFHKRHPTNCHDYFHLWCGTVIFFKMLNTKAKYQVSQLSVQVRKYQNYSIPTVIPVYMH